MIAVQVEHLLTASSGRKAKGDQATGRGADNKVQMVCDPIAKHIFDAGNERGCEDASHTAAIQAQRLEDGRGLGRRTYRGH